MPDRHQIMKSYAKTTLPWSQSFYFSNRRWHLTNSFWLTGFQHSKAISKGFVWNRQTIMRYPNSTFNHSMKCIKISKNNFRIWNKKWRKHKCVGKPKLQARTHRGWTRLEGRTTKPRSIQHRRFHTIMKFIVLRLVYRISRKGHKILSTLWILYRKQLRGKSICQKSFSYKRASAANSSLRISSWNCRHSRLSSRETSVQSVMNSKNWCLTKLGIPKVCYLGHLRQGAGVRWRAEMTIVVICRRWVRLRDIPTR